MSLNRIFVQEPKKQKVNDKIITWLPPAQSSKAKGVNISGVCSHRHPTRKGSSDQKIVAPANRRIKKDAALKLPCIQDGISLGTGDVCEESVVTESPIWHRLTEITFESFLHQVDQIISKLRRKEQNNTDSSLDTSRYRDICEKLRIEIILALDKLHLMTMPKGVCTSDESELLEKLGHLKSQLSDMRWQYHTIIKSLGPKVNNEVFPS